MAATKNILLTGGRSPTALFLARELAREGHRVYVAETTLLHVCRFSNAVTQAFIVPSPRFETQKFIASIANIVHEHAIDLILPTYEEILYLAKAADRFPAHCLQWIPPFAVLDRLHNKWLFHQRLLEYGYLAPTAYLVRSQEEIAQLPFTEPFAMKPCYSRASQQVVKIIPGDPPPPLEFAEYNPWVAQAWLSGSKFCTYSIAHKGRLVAHVTYPVEYSIHGNSCLVFEAVEHRQIQEWVECFVAKEQFTGQIAFDFIVDEKGELFPIECNPRATSGIYLFERQSGFGKVFFPTEEEQTPIFARTGMVKQIAAGMMLYGWKTAYREKKLGSFFKTFFTVGDVVFSARDIKPFLFEPLVMLRYINQSRKWDLKVFAAFTYDCDWDNEAVRNWQLEH